MTPAEQKTYFSTIQEQLESKNVVTFKWLSRKCKIHSTVSKQLLREFIGASSKNEYSASYVVFHKDSNGNLVISLTDESEFDDAFDASSVIDKQIYSIECSSSNINADTLYDEEKLSFQLEQMDLSSINYPTKVGKNLKVKRASCSTTNETNSVATSEKRSASTKVEPKKEKKNQLNFTAVPKSKSDEKTETKTEDKSPKKSLVDTSKETEDKSSKKLPVKTETESKTKSNKASKAPVAGKGSLSSLFQNHRVKNTSSTNSSETNDKDCKSGTVTCESGEKDSSGTSTEKESEKKRSVGRSSPVKGKKTQAKTTKKSTAKSKNKLEKKKLKRVSKAFESSSDESDNDENSSDRETSFDQVEEEPEPKPESEPSAEPEPATCIVQGKKRKRKVLNKSVLGEDGYLYTEKEVVFESCESDDNDENDPNVNQESNKRLKTGENDSNTNAVSKTKSVSPTAEKSSLKNPKAKTKQASIMNFFKKS